MASAHREVRIDRPADVVFDFLADGTNNPKWQPAVVDAGSDEAAPRVGATYRQSVRHPIGFRVPAGYRLTVFERPRRLAFEVSSGGPLRPTGTFELSAATPDGDRRPLHAGLPAAGVGDPGHPAHADREPALPVADVMVEQREDGARGTVPGGCRRLTYGPSRGA